MITSIQVTNFKSWADSGSVKLAPFTGFFGTNSSGKSGLLQMLLLLKQTRDDPDRAQVLRSQWEGESYVDLGTIPELTHGDSRWMEFSMSWTFDEPVVVPRNHVSNGRAEHRLRELFFSNRISHGGRTGRVDWLHYNSPKSGERLAAGLERAGGGQYSVFSQVDQVEPTYRRGRPALISAPVRCYGFPDEAVRTYVDTEYLSDLTLRFEQLMDSLYHLGPLRTYPKRSYSWFGSRPSGIGLKGENAVAALIAAGQELVSLGKGYPRPTLEELVGSWIVEMGLAHSFRLESSDRASDYRVLLRRSKGSREVPLTDLGFGVSQVLPVLVLCYYAPPGSTLILEQPEIHLHPGAQSALADVFIDAIKRRKLQIVVESHSEHLLRRIQRRIAEERIALDDTAFYFTQLNQSGVSELTSLEMDPYGNIRNWPNGFFGDTTGDLIAMAKAQIDARTRGEQS